MNITTDKLEAIAQTAETTLADLAEQLYRIADKIDSLGNRGVSEAVLVAAGLDTRVLKLADAAPVIDGILFYKIAERKNDFEGWMVRRKPSWQLVWCRRFGSLDPSDLHDCATYERMSAAALHAEEERLKRPSPTIAGRSAQRYETSELEWRYQLCQALEQALYGASRRESHEWITTWHERDTEKPPCRAHHALSEIIGHWSETLRGELNYRAEIEQGTKVHSMRRAIPNAVDYFGATMIERLRLGEFTLNELSDLIVVPPRPEVPEVLHVESMRWLQIPDREKVYIDSKTRKYQASIWRYPFKANKDESAEVRAARYDDYLRSTPDLLAQIPDLRGKRALGVRYGTPYFEYDVKQETGHGEVLQRFIALDENRLEELFEQAAAKGIKKHDR